MLTLPEDVGGDGLQLLLHGVYLHEVRPIIVLVLLLDCCLASVMCIPYQWRLQILFNRDNVEDVLRISDRLQVIPVKDACAAWLEREMGAFNVLETLLL